MSFPETATLAQRPDHAESLMEIDRIVFGDLEEEHAGSLDTWEEVSNKRNDTEHVAIGPGGVPIGYIDVFAITEEAARLIMSGKLNDGEFRPEHVAPPGAKDFSLYVMTIAVLPDWQGAGVATRLWNAAVEQWAPQNPIRTLATIWSEQGQKFFRPVKKASIMTDGLGHETMELVLRKKELRVDQSRG